MESQRVEHDWPTFTILYLDGSFFLTCFPAYTENWGLTDADDLRWSLFLQFELRDYKILYQEGCLLKIQFIFVIIVAVTQL